ncbi:17705_t:CDS:2, partial [Cetraspora pellucida]
DGASTMLRCRTGVAAQLKKYNPYLTENHCIAYRLHLASQDAAEQVLYFKKYDALVKEIYLYFIQNTLEEPELVLLNIVSTHWLSFSNVIHNFYRSLKSVKEALLEELTTNQQAASLLTDIDQEFEIITMFLADYFFIMEKLICIFQSDYISFTDIQQYITMTIDAIRAQFIGNNEVLLTYGPNLLEYMAKNNLNLDQLPIFIFEFALATIESLNNRFPNRELFDALKIFDPEQLPNLDNELSNYSNEKIKFLGDFYRLEKIVEDKKFKPPLSKQLLINEWGLVKFFLKNYRSVKFVNAWNLIFTKTSFLLDFPATLTLIQISLIISVSNAAVKRVFSRQNLIKTRLHNQMSIDTLNDHLK